MVSGDSRNYRSGSVAQRLHLNMPTSPSTLLLRPMKHASVGDNPGARTTMNARTRIESPRNLTGAGAESSASAATDIVSYETGNVKLTLFSSASPVPSFQPECAACNATYAAFRIGWPQAPADQIMIAINHESFTPTAIK